MRLSIGQKGLLLVMTPTVLWLIMICVLVAVLAAAEADFQREHRIRQTLSTLDNVEHHIFESAILLYGYSKSQNPVALEQLRKTADLMTKETAELTTMLALEPTISADKGARFTREVNELSATFDSLRRSMSGDDRELNGLELTMLRVNAQQSVKKALELRAPLHDEISRLSASAPAVAAASRSHVVVCLVVIVCLTIGFLFVSLRFFSDSITQRLRVIVDNLRRFGANEALHPQLPAEDEIAAVDNAFHTMAVNVKEAQSREQAAQMFKQQLYDMVNHDLRSPLTFVTGLLYLIQNEVFGSTPEQLRARVDKGIYELTRLTRIFGDVLDYERIQAGKLMLRPTTLSSRECLQEAVDSIGTEAEEKRLTVTVKGEDCSFEGDKDRILQILINLLSNAIKYSPDGGEVTLNSESRIDGVYFMISDCGAGIPAEARGRLFKRLERVEDGAAPQDGAPKGTGLGLSICKLLVEAHGGQIEFDSASDRGTTFWFSIPKVKIAVENVAG